MPEALTIDGIPDDVYAALVRRAAVAGFAVTDYVRTELIALAGPLRRPTATEFWERVERRVHETGTRLSAEQILRARER